MFFKFNIPIHFLNLIFRHDVIGSTILGGLQTTTIAKIKLSSVGRE